MFRLSAVFLSAALSVSTTWAQPVAVTLTLDSSRNGITVSPGAMIDWTVRVSVPAAGSMGLALVAVDLVQDTANPAFFDLPPAGGVPAGMENFSRPLGVSNPGEGGATTGYIGVQRSPTGQSYLNLVQLGGGQNTFGSALPPEYGCGQSAPVVSGVGQAGTPQVIATGSFPAPAAPGAYSFQLENAIANVLESAGSPPVPPAVWPVERATVVLTGGEFGFTVEAMLRGDLNCDGAVTADDVSHFVQALLDPAAYDTDHDGAPYPACQRSRADVNEDALEDGGDIQAFADALLGL